MAGGLGSSGKMQKYRQISSSIIPFFFPILKNLKKIEPEKIKPYHHEITQ